MAGTVKLGVEVLLEERMELLAGRRVGLITNHTGVDSLLRSTVDLLHSHPDVKLTALFGPEHGVRGDAAAGAHVPNAVDPVTGLPAYSLYGDTLRPTADMLADVDVLVYDIQDIGVRYYTYSNTLAHAMAAAKEYGKSVVVLDRPNPIGGEEVEGNIVQPGFFSFIGEHPMPVRHGMTVGELARWFNREIGCDLTVVPMQGWRRLFWWVDTDLAWVPASPNATGMEMAVLYGGTCLLEGTNISEGRGTAKPFEMVGAPWLNGRKLAADLNALELPGVRFRPVYFTPTTSKYVDQLCQGVQVHVVDPPLVAAVRTGLHLIKALRDQNPERFQFLAPRSEGGRYFFDLLAGTDAWRKGLQAGATVDELMHGWEEQRERFMNEREAVMLYPLGL